MDHPLDAWPPGGDERASTGPTGPGLQRAHGALRLDVGRRAEATRLLGLRQEGCLKLLFPRRETGAALEGVLVNSSGGVAACDRLHSTVRCREGASLLLTTQAAERCYRARPGEASATIDVSIRLDADAALEWLPQETILFDCAALVRRLRVEMHDTARLLLAECRVFGRVGSGEIVRSLAFEDRIEIVRAGRLILLDSLRIDGDAHELLERRAVGNGATAAATVILVAADARDRLGRVRALLDEVADPDAGASAWDGMLVVRMVGRDAARQRACLVRVLETLRDGRPLPRVWRS